MSPNWFHTVIDFERGEVYDDRVGPKQAPRRSGHRGKKAARPAARRTKTSRGSPDDDPGEPAQPTRVRWSTYRDLLKDGDL